jgi:hypothetical protein
LRLSLPNCSSIFSDGYEFGTCTTFGPLGPMQEDCNKDYTVILRCIRIQLSFLSFFLFFVFLFFLSFSFFFLSFLSKTLISSSLPTYLHMLSQRKRIQFSLDFLSRCDAQFSCSDCKTLKGPFPHVHAICVDCFDLVRKKCVLNFSAFLFAIFIFGLFP